MKKKIASRPKQQKRRPASATKVIPTSAASSTRLNQLIGKTHYDGTRSLFTTLFMINVACIIVVAIAMAAQTDGLGLLLIVCVLPAFLSYKMSIVVFDIADSTIINLTNNEERKHIQNQVVAQLQSMNDINKEILKLNNYQYMHLKGLSEKAS